MIRVFDLIVNLVFPECPWHFHGLIDSNHLVKSFQQLCLKDALLVSSASVSWYRFVPNYHCSFRLVWPYCFSIQLSLCFRTEEDTISLVVDWKCSCQAKVSLLALLALLLASPLGINLTIFLWSSWYILLNSNITSNSR